MHTVVIVTDRQVYYYDRMWWTSYVANNNLAKNTRWVQNDWLNDIG